jgi:hypothetical protein
MKEQTVEQETKLYAYDLTNEAAEHGFKSTDNWNLTMVTDKGRVEIQKEYFPTVAAQLYPEILLGVYQNIKRRLHQNLSKEEESLTVETILKDDLRHIIAYNPKRQR